MVVLSKECSFFLPVVNDHLVLVRRGAEPYAGYWSGVGGKASHPSGPLTHNQPWLIEKMGGHLATSLSDLARHARGLEYTLGTAIREMREELFTHLSDFDEKDVTDIVRLGDIDDVVNFGEDLIEASNMFYLGRLNRNDFNPSPREVTGIKKLSELAPDDKIVPITRLALVNMRVLLEQEIPLIPHSYRRAISAQLAGERFHPKTTFGNHRMTSMIGLIAARILYDSTYKIA